MGVHIPEVKAFFDDDSNTISYVVSCAETRHAAIIDSVLGLDYASGGISYQLADDMLAYIAQKELVIDWLIETHVHADHLSAAPYLQEKTGGKITISRHIVEVQKIFGKVFNAGTEFERDGSQFDRLLEDQDSYEIGHLQGRAIHTPGHTPACMAQIIGDAIFVGDTLFMPDGGQHGQISRAGMHAPCIKASRKFWHSRTRCGFLFAMIICQADASWAM